MVAGRNPIVQSFLRTIYPFLYYTHPARRWQITPSPFPSPSPSNSLPQGEGAFISVLPELVEGPFMVRQAHHERCWPQYVSLIIPFALSPSAPLRTGLSKGDGEISHCALDPAPVSGAPFSPLYRGDLSRSSPLWSALPSSCSVLGGKRWGHSQILLLPWVRKR